MNRHKKVKDAIVRTIQFLRNNKDDDIELEVRVGQYTSENEFISGYTAEHQKLVSRMIKRFQKSCEMNGERWRAESEKPISMMRSEYEKGIRMTSIPNRPTKYDMKQRIINLDIMTDRQFHLRTSLSKENKVDTATENACKTQEPKSIRLMQRMTFYETVPGYGDFPTVVFAFDITKVSGNGRTKIESTKGDASYHCELELKTKLLPLEDKAKEASQDSLIGDMIIARARALLGTSYMDGASGILRPLPPPELILINKDLN